MRAVTFKSMSQIVICWCACTQSHTGRSPGASTAVFTTGPSANSRTDCISWSAWHSRSRPRTPRRSKIPNRAILVCVAKTVCSRRGGPLLQPVKVSDFSDQVMYRFRFALSVSSTCKSRLNRMASANLQPLTFELSADNLDEVRLSRSYK
jgi:hypothetical protein